MTQVEPEPIDKLRPRQIGKLRVRNVTEVPVNFNMLIYGDAGVGKTVLAGSAAEVEAMCPVLFVDMEGGTLSIRQRYPNIDVVRVLDMHEMMEVYNELAKGRTEYRTVVIDSLTEVQKFSMNVIMRQVVEEDSDRDPDIPSLREWGKNLEQTRRFVRAFRDLPINTIFTALSVTDKDNKGKTKTKPGLTGKASGEVAAFLDIVTYMYIKEVEEQQVRLLLTQQTDKIIAKDRTDRLPMIMEDPTMASIYKLAFIANDEPDNLEN